MMVPDKMQATLVSFYGKKPEPLKNFIVACQNKVLEAIGGSFLPYELEQVHGTIIGLEGVRDAEKIKNANFEASLAQERWIDPIELLTFLQSNELRSISVEIGGYSSVFKEFSSRGEVPFKRSFSIQGDIVVIMGWPLAAEKGHYLLDNYRRSFNEVNVLHKWHRRPAEIDDDFYLVLGRVRSLDEEAKVHLVDIMRHYLSTQNSISVAIEKKYLSIVGYIDPQLPCSTSCELPLLSEKLTSRRLLTLYPKIVRKQNRKGF
jgi:hypothetical protein